MTHRCFFPCTKTHTNRGSLAALALLAGFGMVISAGGCNGVGVIGGGALGGECMLDSDCNADLICAYQFCHIPCVETRDCDVAGGEECLMSHETDKDPYNYCTIPIACAGNAECGDSRVCAEDKKCRDACFQDGDCLGDQRCYQGGCRNVSNPPKDWNQPAGLGAPCRIPSDCASKNCNGVCVGCAEDFDCGGSRTCDPTALDNTGICTSVSTKLSAKVTLIDTAGIRMSEAVPDSEGKFIYFVGDYSSGVKGVFRRGTDGSICTLFTDEKFVPDRIAISADDTTLFVNALWQGNSSGAGISTIALPEPTKCELSLPQAIPWTAGLSHATSIVVSSDPDKNDISFLYDGGLAIGSLDSGTTPEYTYPMYSEIAIGGTRTFLMTGMNQLAEIKQDMSITLLASHVNISGLTCLRARGMALNLANDTIYVPDYGDGQHSLVAINLDNPLKNTRYDMDAGFGVFVAGFPCWRSIRRAQNKNIFYWVTDEGNLYLFEPQ